MKNIVIKAYKEQSHESPNRQLRYKKTEISLISCKTVGNKRFYKSVSTHLDEFIRFNMSEFVNYFQISLRW